MRVKTLGPMLYYWTDGSVLVNPDGPGGWAFVRSDTLTCEAPHEQSGHLPSTTNNRAELTAILKALEDAPDDARVTIFSDSQWCINTAMRKWKAEKNTDLLRDVWREMGRVNAVFSWVRGHNMDLGNSRADVLAGEAARKRMKHGKA